MLEAFAALGKSTMPKHGYTKMRTCFCFECVVQEQTIHRQLEKIGDDSEHKGLGVPTRRQVERRAHRVRAKIVRCGRIASVVCFDVTSALLKDSKLIRIPGHEQIVRIALWQRPLLFRSGLQQLKGLHVTQRGPAAN